MKVRRVQNRDLVEGNILLYDDILHGLVRRLEYFDADYDCWQIRYGDVEGDTIVWHEGLTPTTSDFCRANYWIEDDPCRCFPKLNWKAERCLDCILKYYP
jgi:hypothetical protein